MLAELLGSRLRARVIGWFFSHVHERYFVRQVTTLLGEDSTNLSRELARLARLGVLSVRERGRQKYYQADPRCPVFAELRGIAVKTTGLGDAIRDALEPISTRIDVAFLFGSIAGGTEHAESDVALLVVGRTSLREVAEALGGVCRATGREINAVVYRRAEFRDKLADRHHFVVRVLKGPKVFLIGEARDLSRTARGGASASAEDDSSRSRRPLSGRGA